MCFQQPTEYLLRFFIQLHVTAVFLWSPSDESILKRNITMWNKQLTELSVIEKTVSVLIIPSKDQHCLFFQNTIVLLLSDLGKSMHKFIKLDITSFILVKVLENLEEIEIRFPCQLTFDFLRLFLHEDLVLEELSQLFGDGTSWDLWWLLLKGLLLMLLVLEGVTGGVDVGNVYLWFAVDAFRAVGVSEWLGEFDGVVALLVLTSSSERSRWDSAMLVHLLLALLCHIAVQDAKFRWVLDMCKGGAAILIQR